MRFGKCLASSRSPGASHPIPYGRDHGCSEYECCDAGFLATTYSVRCPSLSADTGASDYVRDRLRAGGYARRETFIAASTARTALLLTGDYTGQVFAVDDADGHEPRTSYVLRERLGRWPKWRLLELAVLWWSACGLQGHQTDPSLLCLMGAWIEFESSTE